MDKKIIGFVLIALLVGICIPLPGNGPQFIPIVSGNGSCPTTEAELEAQLTDVNDVYTNNDFLENAANWDNAYTWSNALYNTIGLSALTSAEVDQLENIGANTITAAIWGFVSNMNQDVATTDDVEFKSVSIENKGSIYYGTNENITIESDLNTSFINNDLETFDINESGIWSSKYQPGCRVRLEVFQPIPAGIWTKLILVIEDYDRHNDYNTATTQFIVPKTGYYICEYSATLINAIGTGVWGSAIYVNALMAGAYEYSHKISDVEDKIANSGTDILYLTKNDFVELWVFQSGFLFAPNCPALTYSNYMAITKIA